MTSTGHDSLKTRRTLTVDGSDYDYYSIEAAGQALGIDFSKLPFSMKVLLENMLRFEDGRLTEVAACDADQACDLFVGATEEVWRELLAPVPRPFYQDLFGAQLHHGVRLSPEPLDYAAYYPALRRLVQLLSAFREDA